MPGGDQSGPQGPGAGSLASTGTYVVAIGAIGTALALTGVLLLLAVRRRRSGATA